MKEETSRTINVGELWYDSMTGTALDVSQADELVTAAEGIAWAELVEPTASDAELTSFGVNEASATAITLYESKSVVLTLLIGAQNEDGDYYARLPGSTMVYTVENSAVASLLTASAQAMPSMVLIDLATDQMQAATFTAGEHSYTWQASTAEATEADASENDADEAADDPGEALWASILALDADSRIDAPSGNVLLTVEATAQDGQSAMLTFAEYDAEHYAVTVLDRCFLVDAAKVDTIIRNLRAIK